MNMDQIRGRIAVLVGELLGLCGQITGSAALEAQGQRAKRIGGARADYGNAKADVMRRVSRSGH
jgi:uncharacterized protein YjbJ (UPF0337 family)